MVAASGGTPTASALAGAPHPFVESGCRGLVFDLFAGIGGSTYALRLAGLSNSPLDYFTVLVENDPGCRDVLLEHLVDDSHELFDVADGSVERLLDDNILEGYLDRFPAASFILFVGGSPCQGFSRANRLRLGLADPRSQLIWVFGVAVARARAHLCRRGRHRSIVHFLIENVDMNSLHAKTISDYLGCNSILSCASSVSSTARSRRYWTSLPASSFIPPVTPRDAVPDPQWSSLLPPGDDRPWLIPTRPHRPGRPPELPTPFWSFGSSSYSARHLVLHTSATTAAQQLAARLRPLVNFSGNDLLSFVYDIHTTALGESLRPLNADELERALGYPHGSSASSKLPRPGDPPGDFARIARLCNGFSVPAVAVLLHPWVVGLTASVRHGVPPGPPPLGAGPSLLTRAEALDRLLLGGRRRPGLL